MSYFFARPFRATGYRFMSGIIGGGRRRRYGKRYNRRRRRKKKGVGVLFQSNATGNYWVKRYKNYYKAKRAKAALANSHNVIEMKSVWGKYGMSKLFDKARTSNSGGKSVY